MNISNPKDYRNAAKKRLPQFLFDYIDGGSYSEKTLRDNVSDLQDIIIEQRILRDVGEIKTEINLFGKNLAMPVVLSPVGMAGMYARRGEAQIAEAALNHNIPFALSTVSICSIEEILKAIPNAPMWFQLYVLKDRGFMKHALEAAQNNGVETLVFTADMPVPGARYRDYHSGMIGKYANFQRIGQAILHPFWAWDVGVIGKPHDLGNISPYLGKPTGLQDYMGWIGNNFDPSISWKDLEWIRDFWKGSIIIKGILHPDDAKDAVKFGADGIVVSNHGGRQLDGTLSTTKALPPIAAAVKGQTKILVDGGIRSGLDVLRMLNLGADCTMIGRAYIYALAADGQNGVENLLTIFKNELRAAMALSGVKSL